jgi:serine/threonine protein kinase
LGFCLEHGRGVCQNIELAAEYYKRAADCGHPEAEQNYQRCLRLLGRWNVPDRSSIVSEEKPSFDERKIEGADRVTSSLKMFAETKQSIQSMKSWRFGEQIWEDRFSVVKLAEDPQRKVKRAVKTIRSSMNIRYLKRESSFLARLNHPLIVGFEGHIPATVTHSEALVTELVPNGSLSDHLPSFDNSTESIITGETRIAIIVIGIVLAMRYVHSCGIIHCNLKPTNIFVDWDWIVRIGDFSHSVIVDEVQGEASSDQSSSFAAHYSAPECFDNSPHFKSDVFSFGVILCKLLSGETEFSRYLSPCRLMGQVLLNDFRPPIPNFLCDEVKQLICDCWESDPDERPSFVEILFRLDRMDFRITRNVKPWKVRQFVNAVKTREKILGIKINDLD